MLLTDWSTVQTDKLCLSGQHFKVPLTSKFLFPHLILCITQWTSPAKKDLIQIKCYHIFLTIIFKNLQICRHIGLPFAPVFPWFLRSCDIDSETCYFRLDSSCLFYLRKFRLVVQNASKKHFVWTTKLNLQRLNKQYESAWSHIFLNLHHNSEHDVVISSMGWPQENRIFRFLKIH